MDVTVVPERYIEESDTLVVLHTWRGTYPKTGKTVEYPNAHVFDFKDEKIVQWTSDADTALFNAAIDD